MNKRKLENQLAKKYSGENYMKVSLDLYLKFSYDMVPLLSYYINQSIYFKSLNKNSNDYFFRTQEHISKKLNISVHRIRTYKKELIRLGILFSKLKKAGHKEWFKVNYIKLDQFLYGVNEFNSIKNKNREALNSLRGGVKVSKDPYNKIILKEKKKKNKEKKILKKKNTTILKRVPPLKRKKVFKYFFDTKQFKDAWDAWVEMKWVVHKFKYATVDTEQAAMSTAAKIFKYNERKTIDLILDCTGRQWQGIKHYPNKLYSNNGQTYSPKSMQPNKIIKHDPSQTLEEIFNSGGSSHYYLQPLFNSLYENNLTRNKIKEGLDKKTMAKAFTNFNNTVQKKYDGNVAVHYIQWLIRKTTSTFPTVINEGTFENIDGGMFRLFWNDYCNANNINRKTGIHY